MDWRDVEGDAWEPPRDVARDRILIGDAEGAPVLEVAAAGRGSGPTILVVGGTHGDEFEGQVAALELVRALPDLTVTGRLLVLPFHHRAACRTGTRASPLDGRDLNRAYGLPGGPGEGPTADLARFVETRVLPEADVVIDLHSGGAAHRFVVSSNLQAAIGGEEQERMMPALLAFDAPYAITFDEAGEAAMPHAGTLEGAARAMGRAALSSELGGGGTLTMPSLAAARTGLVNLLHHFGVVRSTVATSWRESRSRRLTLSRPEEHLTTPVAGWFVPTVDLGDVVAAGDVVGHVAPDEDPFGDGVVVAADVSGVVVALAHPVRQGAGAVVAYVAALG